MLEAGLAGDRYQWRRALDEPSRLYVSKAHIILASKLTHVSDWISRPIVFVFIFLLQSIPYRSLIFSSLWYDFPTYYTARQNSANQPSIWKPGCSATKVKFETSRFAKNLFSQKYFQPSPLSSLSWRFQYFSSMIHSAKSTNITPNDVQHLLHYLRALCIKMWRCEQLKVETVLKSTCVCVSKKMKYEARACNIEQI